MTAPKGGRPRRRHPIAALAAGVVVLGAPAAALGAATPVATDGAATLVVGPVQHELRDGGSVRFNPFQYGQDLLVAAPAPVAVEVAAPVTTSARPGTIVLPGRPANRQLPQITTTARPGTAAAVAIDFALAQRGLPYIWGGNGPEQGDDGFDCSGLTTFAYAEAGVELPRTAHTQYYAGPHVPSGADLEPGDLVFFGVPERVHHVGMYVGNGTMVNAPSRGKPVRLAQVRFDGDDYLGATRPAAGRDAPPGSGLIETPDLPVEVPPLPLPDAPPGPEEFPNPPAPDDALPPAVELPAAEDPTADLALAAPDAGISAIPAEPGIEGAAEGGADGVVEDGSDATATATADGAEDGADGTGDGPEDGSGSGDGSDSGDTAGIGDGSGAGDTAGADPGSTDVPDSDIPDSGAADVEGSADGAAEEGDDSAAGDPVDPSTPTMPTTPPVTAPLAPTPPGTPPTPPGTPPADGGAPAAPPVPGAPVPGAPVPGAPVPDVPETPPTPGDQAIPPTTEPPVESPTTTEPPATPEPSATPEPTEEPEATAVAKPVSLALPGGEELRLRGTERDEDGMPVALDDAGGIRWDPERGRGSVVLPEGTDVSALTGGATITLTAEDGTTTELTIGTVRTTGTAEAADLTRGAGEGVVLVLVLPGADGEVRVVTAEA